jgi:hypothetical protein
METYSACTPHVNVDKHNAKRQDFQFRAPGLSHQKQRNSLNTEGAETQRKTEKGRGREDTSLMNLCVLWDEKFDALTLFRALDGM